MRDPRLSQLKNYNLTKSFIDRILVEEQSGSFKGRRVQTQMFTVKQINQKTLLSKTIANFDLIVLRKLSIKTAKNIVNTH